METPEPGRIVTPNGQPQPSAVPDSPAPQQVPGGQPPAQLEPVQDTPPEFQPQSREDQGAGDTISWTASEYIAHHKPAGWYMALSLGAIGIAAIVYFVTGGDVTSVIVVLLAAIIFGAVGARKPKEQHFSIGHDGVSIGSKFYNFDQFKSFSIVDEDAFASITFMPMRRFMPAISIYYDPQDEDHIVEVLSVYLPIEDRGRDPIDRLMKKIRF